MKAIPLFRQARKTKAKPPKQVPEDNLYSVEAAWGGKFLVQASTVQAACKIVTDFVRDLDVQGGMVDIADTPIEKVEQVNYAYLLIDQSAPKIQRRKKAVDGRRKAKK